MSDLEPGDEVTYSVASGWKKVVYRGIIICRLRRQSRYRVRLWSDEGKDWVADLFRVGDSNRLTN
jgi:hypothetical protein